MAVVPSALLESLKHLPQFDAAAFAAVHAAEEKVTSVRINEAKFSAEEIFETAHAAPGGAAVEVTLVPWSRAGFYLSRRPSFTFDPHFHAGCYYVQEASSQFLEQALQQTVDLAQPMKVLDLCAAPGGKSTHLQSLISANSLLVTNEVIKTRAGILRQNMTKWGGANVVVTNNDPQHFARLQGFFDVLVVDAPCSGSGLFRREPQAIEEWSPEAVQLCCGRQKRILADALPCLRDGGILIYATCSYSAEEDEQIGDWLLQEEGMENKRLNIQPQWGIVESLSEKGAYGYRFFPDKVQGEGLYMACFEKKGGSEVRYKMAKPERASAKEKTAVAPWLAGDGLELLKEGVLYAMPEGLLEWYSTVKGALYVQQAGIRLGEVMKDKLVPDHALALSTVLSPNVPSVELDYENAIRYLQRQEISTMPADRGWHTARYRQHALGWMNALGNRINNYYPKEFRILKQQ